MVLNGVKYVILENEFGFLLNNHSLCTYDQTDP